MFKQLIICALLIAPFSYSSQTTPNTEWLQEHIATIPDFPQPGIQFKWIGPLLKNPPAFKKAIKLFADRYQDGAIDAIVALDARGFIFGTALAYELGLPIVLVRKAGKIPGDVITKSYELEYGKSTFEMEKNSLQPDQKVLIIDDLVATGGTVCAAGQLVESQGAKVVEVAALIELLALKGRDRIPYPVFTLMQIP